MYAFYHRVCAKRKLARFVLGGRPCPPLVAAAVQDVRRFYQYRLRMAAVPRSSELQLLLKLIVKIGHPCPIFTGGKPHVSQDRCRDRSGCRCSDKHERR